MKLLQVSLLALLLSDCNAAWTPSMHRAKLGRPAPSTTTTSSASAVGPLHMSPSNSTNSKERQEPRTRVDLDSDKFMSGMDRELEDLQKQYNSTMDAYSQALQQNFESHPPSPPTSQDRDASSTRGKGFGKSPANEAKKKSFMEKNRRSTTKEPTGDKPQPQDMIADQIVNQLETNSPPTPPSAQEKKTPRDLIQEAKRARASQESAKEEKATYFPPKPDPITEKKKPADPVAETKDDTTTIAEKKTYFPPSSMKKDIVPPAPKAKEETTKTYFPPTPMAKKPPVVQKEEPTKTKEKSIPTPSDPVVKPVAEEKPVTMETKKQEETPAPVKPKKEPIFKKKSLKPEPIAKKEEPVAKQEEPVAKVETKPQPKVPPTPPKTAAPVKEIPKPVTDPVSKVGSSAPMDTGVAASKVTEKIRMDPTPPTKKKSKKKFEMPRMDFPKIELPKINLPKADFDPATMAKKFDFKLDQNTVDQAKEFAKNAGTTMADAAQVVAKDGKDWVLRLQGSLNTTKVEDLDITYEEAFQKVARSGRGFLKICSLVGSAVKDTTMIFANELQKGSGKTKSSGKTTKSSVPKKTSPAVSNNNNLQSSTMSFLEGLGKAPTLGDVEEEKPKVEEAPVVKKNRINFRDIVLPEPNLNNVEPPKEDAFEAVDEVNEIKTKASSMFGSFWSSASSFADTVKNKAMEESEKMQAASKKNSPSMSKTKPVDGLKRKKGLFFLDAEDE